MKFIIRGAAFAAVCALGLSTVPAPAAENVTLTAAVASSAYKPIEFLFREFEKKHPGVTIKHAQNNGMSGGDIQKAIDTGAGVDAAPTAGSADIVVVGESQTKYLTDQGRINTPIHILTQKEMVLVPARGAKVKSLKDLANAGIKVGMALPESAVGKPAADMLKNANKDPAYGPGFGAAVIANRKCETLKGSEVPEFIRSGKCDAAIGYVSDRENNVINGIVIPDSINVSTPYYVFVPKASKNQKLAEELAKFVASKHGMTVLESYHYIPASK